MTDSHKKDLIFWRDITPCGSPTQQPTHSSPHILIVGGGVTGLVTAWVLLDQGYRVTIVSKEWASYGKSQRLTSQIAGALWEFPPAVCGQHTDAVSLQISKRWCMTAYHIWEQIISFSTEKGVDTGARMIKSDFFFPYKIEDDVTQESKMLEIMASGVRGFRHDSKIIEERRVNPSYGAVDAYEFLAPIIDTDQAMSWLMNLVQEKGASLISRRIEGDLFTLESELRKQYMADAIVNATGLAASELAGDKTCYPLRGALIRVVNDGSSFPKLDHALAIAADALHDSSQIVFLVPRNDKILLIGGIAESNEHELSLTLDSPIIKWMRTRCENFLPDLKNAQLDPDYPLAQGLRPSRRQNVRVERELRQRHGAPPSRIVHSYGHGGSGWSLSFGCAGDVAALLKEALLNLPPRAMAEEVAGGLVAQALK
jgi:D-amino-acid oxidase